MSNILIIKHGSLGDIAQASGAIQDIFENHKECRIYVMTTKPYVDLLKRNPFVTDVILDKRLSRINFIYLYLLMRKLKKLNFIKVYDLQNSSRTRFYKRILFPKSNYTQWSSSDTTLPDDTLKEEFDTKPVLNRFDHQLLFSGIKTQHTMKPNFQWSCSNIDTIINEYNLDNYIILFPFSSPHLTKKQCPYYNELIDLLKKKFENKFKIVTAPGPLEINEAKKIKALCILKNQKALNISELSSLILRSSFVIANDTGPAHIAAHLNVRGITLFGEHTSAKKVSIEREKFKAIQVSNLEKLSANKVLEKIEL